MQDSSGGGISGSRPESVPAPSAPPAGSPAPPLGGLGFGLAVLLLSTAVLSYETGQIRIFAYAVNPAFVYVAIAITMLGFGLAGTVLALSARLRRLPADAVFAASCLGFAASGFLASAVFARASGGMNFQPSLSATFTAATVLIVVLCTLPYAFAGLAFAAVLSRAGAGTGRLYALNLAGSALGCLAVNVLLRPLGAGPLILVLLAAAAGAGALAAGRGLPRLRWASLGCAALLAASSFGGRFVLPFQPDGRDALAAAIDAYREAGAGEPVREWEAWDPVGKIDITSWKYRFVLTPFPFPFKAFTQDGGAASVLVGQDDVRHDDMRIYDDTVYGVGLQLRPHADVVVIGLGGGPDIQAALHHGARSIVGVEINQAAVDAVRGPFSHFMGDPYRKPNVDIVVKDGRSFVRSTDRRFDLLQMTGTDTLTVQSSGSFVFAESYLYTVEAFEDYLRVIRPDGLLSIVRFGVEPYRLGAIAATALRRLGVDRPELCIVVLSQARMKATLVKKVPFTTEELDELDRIAERSGDSNAGIVFPPYDAAGLRLGDPLVRLYAPQRAGNWPDLDRLFADLGAGRDASVPILPTDDRPFYFAADLASYIQGGPVSAHALGQIRTYVRFIALLAVLAVVLIVAPLVAFRRSGLRAKGAAAVLAYFFLIGICYMLVEVALLQKTVLVVEHPSYSVSIVLASLLGASALGSWLSGRLRLSPRKIVGLAVGAIVVLGTAYALLMTPLFQALLAWPFALRMLAVALLIAPLGAAMGMLFPTGLAVLADGSGPLAAWAFGVNGFASVLGTVLSMPLAVLFGFTDVLAIAAGAYLLAGLSFLALRRS